MHGAGPSVNDAELKATMARLDVEEAAGVKCGCYKCILERTELYPGIAQMVKPKKKRVPGPKKQTDQDLHDEHGA